MYHYTDANALINIVSKRELWLTHSDYLNDYNEGKCFDSIFKNLLKDFPDIINLLNFIELTTETYCLSFSEKGDVLSQWRGYCPSQGGYSLGFEDNILSSPFSIIGAAKISEQFNLISFAECTYSEQELLKVAKKMADSLKESYAILTSKNNPSLITYLDSGFLDLEVEDIDEINKLLLSQADWFNCLSTKMCFKDASFSEESEKRLFVNVNKGSVEAFYRVKNSIVVPYLKFQFSEQFLKKIIIGPTADENLAQSGIEHYLRHAFGKKANLKSFIKLSKIPFRNI